MVTIDEESASGNRDTEDIRDRVRADYAATAIAVLNRAGQLSCCDSSVCCAPDERPSGEDHRFGAALYADDERRVVNLSVDKPAVFASIFRVLTPGGRLGFSDVVADDALTREQRGERGGWASCIAGALAESEYRRGLMDAGFTDVTITCTHPVADGMHSATVRATKPRT